MKYKIIDKVVQNVSDLKAGDIISDNKCLYIVKEVPVTTSTPLVLIGLEDGKLYKIESTLIEKTDKVLGFIGTSTR